MKDTADQTTALGSERQSFLSGGMLIVLFLAFAKFLFHWYFNNRYGYFRD